MGFADFLFGGSSGGGVKQVDALDSTQKSVMRDLAAASRNPLSTYTEMPEERFTQSIQNPMNTEFQRLRRSGLATPELHSSSFARGQERMTGDYLSNLGAARQRWLMEQQIRKEQAMESALGRQMQQRGTILGTTTRNQLVTPGTQNRGLLGMIGDVAATGTALGQFGSGIRANYAEDPYNSMVQEEGRRQIGMKP